MSSRFITRKEAAEYLTAKGFITSPLTLAKLACVGGGLASTNSVDARSIQKPT